MRRCLRCSGSGCVTGVRNTSAMIARRPGAGDPHFPRDVSPKSRVHGSSQVIHNGGFHVWGPLRWASDQTLSIHIQSFRPVYRRFEQVIHKSAEITQPPFKSSVRSDFGVSNSVAYPLAPDICSGCSHSQASRLPERPVACSQPRLRRLPTENSPSAHNAPTSWEAVCSRFPSIGNRMSGPFREVISGNGL